MTSTWDAMITRARAGEVSKGEIIELIDLLHDLDHDIASGCKLYTHRPGHQIIADAWEERIYQMTGVYLHDREPESIEKRRQVFNMREEG